MREVKRKAKLFVDNLCSSLERMKAEHGTSPDFILIREYTPKVSSVSSAEDYIEKTIAYIEMRKEEDSLFNDLYKTTVIFAPAVTIGREEIGAYFVEGRYEILKKWKLEDGSPHIIKHGKLEGAGIAICGEIYKIRNVENLKQPIIFNPSYEGDDIGYCFANYAAVYGEEIAKLLCKMFGYSHKEEEITKQRNSFYATILGEKPIALVRSDVHYCFGLMNPFTEGINLNEFIYYPRSDEAFIAFEI